MRDGSEIYERLVRSETADERRRGVRLLIAHHGAAHYGQRFASLKAVVRGALARVRATHDVECMSLDEPLRTTGPEALQPDGHWSARGHAVVANEL